MDDQDHNQDNPQYFKLTPDETRFAMATSMLPKLMNGALTGKPGANQDESPGFGSYQFLYFKLPEVGRPFMGFRFPDGPFHTSEVVEVKATDNRTVEFTTRSGTLYVLEMERVPQGLN